MLKNQTPISYDNRLTTKEFGLLFRENDNEDFDGSELELLFKTAPLGDI